jgi:acyl carrier protein
MSERVYEIVASMLRVPRESLNPDSSPDTVPQWDSLRHLQIVLALEEALGIHLTVEEIEAMQTMGVIVAIVESHDAGDRS